MKGVVIAGGEIKDYHRISKLIDPDAFIVCADSGYDHAKKMGITPDLVVGDMDSVHSSVLESIPLKKYPCKKDFTDTQLAIQYALEQGCTELLLLAVTGSRLDHSLANIFLLKELVDLGIQAVIANETNEIHIVVNRIALPGEAGNILSLIPITPCKDVTTQNLEYPLSHADLPFGPTVGVSNVFLGSQATVTLSEGYLLAIKSRDEDPND